MNTTPWQQIARATLQGAEADTMSFPEAVRMLTEAGFDGYAVDFRAATRICYRPDGASIALPTEHTAPVGETFDTARVRAAIAEAQAQAPGYSYTGFCARVAAAGCAGYLVSLIGRRVLYYGRTGETHTEYFPGTQPPAAP